MKYLIPPLFALFASFGLLAQTSPVPVKAAVVHAHFDAIDQVLKSYEIPFDSIPHKSIEDLSVLSKYDVVFFPCGIGISPDTSINILARGTKLEGLELKDEYYQVDNKKAAESITRFVSGGGIAIFSDFSIDIMQNAFGTVSYYRDFPNLGLAGSYRMSASADFASFINRDYYDLSFSHSGWVLCERVKGAKGYLSGAVQTPIGTKEALVAGNFRHDKGSVFFSSYHSDSSYNELARFIVCRAWGDKYLAKNRRYIGGWDLKPSVMVADIALAGEAFREYRIKPQKGRFTLFAFFTSGRWKVEVYTPAGRYVSGKSVRGKLLKLDLKNNGDGYIVRVTPVSQNNGVLYSLGVGEGFRFFPYYKRVAFWLSVLTLFILYHKLIKKRRFSALPHRGADDENTL